MLSVYSYIFACSILSLYSFFFKGKIVWLIVLTVIVHLYFFPSTELDYDYYMADYESGFFDGNWPYFHTAGYVTAEPLYRLYTAFISVLTKSSFQFFLVLNFLICFFLLKKSLFFIGDSKYLFFMMALPVIIPTVFYYSPRSSISFVFVFIGLVSLMHERKVLAIFFFLLGISVHSQYIPAVFYMLSVSFMVRFRPKIRILILLFYNSVIALFLIELANIVPAVSALLSFLPSAGVATSKLHYFSSLESGGFRITSVLSILVFPVMAFLVLRNRARLHSFYYFRDFLVLDKMLFYILSLVLLSLVINVSFINIPHLSGRLSRFSDYVSFMFLIPFFFSLYLKKSQVQLVALLFILIAPFLFPAIYN